MARKPELSEADRDALMARSMYEPTEPYPGDRKARWSMCCLLCGKEISTRLESLEHADELPSRRRTGGQRIKCSHPVNIRKQLDPRYQAPRPLTQAQARALLDELGELQLAEGTHLYWGIVKLRYIARLPLP